MTRDATRTTAPRTLLSQLGTLLRVTGARPRQWILGTVAASVVLALLDMAGVAAMLPLMSLITTGQAQGAENSSHDAFSFRDSAASFCRSAHSPSSR